MKMVLEIEATKGWLVSYNEDGRDKEQWFTEKESMEHFTAKLKERGIQYKVEQKDEAGWVPKTGKVEVEHPDRQVDDKQVQKKSFVEDALKEFQIELIPSTPTKGIVNYNGEEVPMSSLPKNVYDTVKFVLNKLRPEEKKDFFADDTSNWDITLKADGTIVVTDDKGNDWTKILKQRIQKAKL